MPADPTETTEISTSREKKKKAPYNHENDSSKFGHCAIISSYFVILFGQRTHILT